MLWINGADDALDAVVTAAGFRRLSEQFQMRVPLPLAESPRWPAGIVVRAFVPGQDDDEWLRVNNRAFADHPDQGGWSEETLKARTAESVVRSGWLPARLRRGGAQPGAGTKCAGRSDPEARARRVLLDQGARSRRARIRGSGRST